MTETKPKRRWFRFSLRTLFVLVTIIGVGAGYAIKSGSLDGAARRIHTDT